MIEPVETPNQSTSQGRAVPRLRTVFANHKGLAGSLVLLGLFYLAKYAVSDERPHAGTPGWWSWFDQGAYLRSIVAFSNGQLDPAAHLYPPLYPLLAAPFWRLSHVHPTLVPDLVYFLISYGCLLLVLRRFYGLIVPTLVVAALFLFAPVLTIQQWVIPWTTSLSCALISVLLLIYAHAETRAAPFRLARGRDWALFGLFFLVYGALTPTRPLDEIVWFPFALVFFVRTLWASVRTAPPGTRPRVALGVIAVAGGAPLVFCLGYIGFNLALFHSATGSYGALALGGGYFPDQLLQKIFSLLWDSQTIFVGRDQALFQRFPAFAAIFAVCLVTAFTVRDVRALAVATAVFNFLVYAPYGDLIPLGLFRYFNVHYFKWAYPWLAVIAAGQVVLWLKTLKDGDRHGKRLSLACVAASGAVLAAGLVLDIRPVSLTQVADTRDSVSHTVSIHLQRPQRVRFIDVQGQTGSFEDFYFAPPRLLIDGKPVPLNEARIIPGAREGGRIVLLIPRQVRDLTWSVAPNIGFASGHGSSTVGSEEIVFKPMHQDALPPPIPWAGGVVKIEPAANGETHDALFIGWSGAEAAGRWTTQKDASISLRLARPSRPVRLSSTFYPLMGGRITEDKVSVVVNGCAVAKRTFLASQPQTVDTPIPDRCLRPDGQLSVHWISHHVATPAKLHINGDTRPLAVFVSNLQLSQEAEKGAPELQHGR